MTATSTLTSPEPAPDRDGDPVLLPFLAALDEEAARRHLGELLERQASPLALQVIRGHLRGPAREDVEDVHAGVLLRLAAHLRTLRTREGGEEAAIRDFAGYVAVVAHNACHALLRERSPQRARLRTRTRYVLTRDPRLALWEGGGREWLCGTAFQRGGAWDARTPSLLLEMSRQEAPRPFPDLVHATVTGLPGPARFDDVVDALAAILDVSDDPPAARPHDEGGAARAREVADPSPPADEAFHQRSFLARLWAEIRELPSRQRAALLLNLRDADGRGMIGFFPITGTASVTDLARALDMAEPRLRELWEGLPRDDEWIAGQLGITRRQVINLRKCARERLARRMRKDGWS